MGTLRNRTQVTKQDHERLLASLVGDWLRIRLYNYEDIDGPGEEVWGRVRSVDLEAETIDLVAPERVIDLRDIESISDISPRNSPLPQGEGHPP